MSELQIKCPNCKEITHWNLNPYRPFCSERCQNTDFLHWATDQYQIGDQAELEDSLFSESNLLHHDQKH